MITETTLTLPDGRELRVHDTGPTGAPNELAVFWQHGTPNVGAPPAPLFDDAARLGLRWVGHDRPGYGGSSPLPGRDVASAAADVAHAADALGISRFAVFGHSGGGPHALACAARLPDRVVAAVVIAGLAPFDRPDFDGFAGMSPSGEASLRAAARGRAAKEAHQAAAAGGVPDFTPADEAALEGEWAWLLDVVRPALVNGPAPLIDDDLAYVAPWGFAPEEVAAPVLLLHGAEDRVVPVAHAEWLARRLPRAELRVGPEDGHLSVLRLARGALPWLRERADLQAN